MKGIFKLTEGLVKMITTAYLALVLLAVFFAINNYYLYYVDGKSNREALIIADSVLGADCLVKIKDGYPIKGFFTRYDENGKIKLKDHDNIVPSCLKINKDIYIEILDENKNRLFRIGMTSLKYDADVHYSTFPAAYDDGNTISPVILNLSIK